MKDPTTVVDRIPTRADTTSTRWYSSLRTGDDAMSSSVRLRTGDCQLYTAFGAAWAPFGGPRDEDIFPMFGVVPRVFFGRLLKIISSHEAAQEISLEVRTRIVQSCANRLCPNESEAPVAGVRSPANSAGAEQQPGVGSARSPSRHGAGLDQKGYGRSIPPWRIKKSGRCLNSDVMTDQ